MAFSLKTLLLLAGILLLIGSFAASIFAAPAATQNLLPEQPQGLDPDQTRAFSGHVYAGIAPNTSAPLRG